MTFVCLIIPLVGCQQLFHAQDAPLKGQTVTVSMTVPTEPPPAAKPIAPASEQVVQQNKPTQALLDSRLLPVQSPATTDPMILKLASASRPPQQSRSARVQVFKAETVLSGKTVAEDLVLRGTVLVKGSLVVSPQATLRIEPGAVIRFAAVPGSEELPRIVIQGRIVAAGTVQQPIVLGSAFSEPAAGDWGGVVLLNSEKKNSLEHCRIEGARTGLEMYFSRFSGRGLTINRSQSGVSLFDSEASLQGCIISRCDTACRLSDSELDLKDSTVSENRLGIISHRSSFTLTTSKVVNNSQEGVFADQSRFRLSGCLFSENRSGAKLSGGDGQVFLCRFNQNRENGVELLGARIRITTSSFTQNGIAGVLVENARGSIVGSAFSDNGKVNLSNRGQEMFAAVLNWWGSTDEKLIAAGVTSSGGKDTSSLVLFVPFLKERPATTP